MVDYASLIHPTSYGSGRLNPRLRERAMVSQSGSTTLADIAERALHLVFSDGMLDDLRDRTIGLWGDRDFRSQFQGSLQVDGKSRKRL